MEKKLAAFIMTYERPDEVLIMIDKLFSQTFPPGKILVVDNSKGTETHRAVANLNNKAVEYFRVGHNSGPAGAAKRGLEKLSEEGFEWIYWGDDNDPPRTNDAFENLLTMQKGREDQPIGMLGLMGNTFDLHKAKVKLPTQKELVGVQSVNSMAGGSTMLVNSAVVRAGVVPDEDLFFGYEELDFCLRLKAAGFDILMDADYYRKAKQQSVKKKLTRSERMGFNVREKFLWREYYSIRNLLIIVGKKNRSIRGITTLFFRALAKMVLSYSKGLRFGFRYSSLVLRAIFDFATNRKGMRVAPGSI